MQGIQRLALVPTILEVDRVPFKRTTVFQNPSASFHDCWNEGMFPFNHHPTQDSCSTATSTTPNVGTVLNEQGIPTNGVLTLLSAASEQCGFTHTHQDLNPRLNGRNTLAFFNHDVHHLWECTVRVVLARNTCGVAPRGRHDLGGLKLTRVWLVITRPFLRKQREPSQLLTLFKLDPNS